jgi:hypothetical protein
MNVTTMKITSAHRSLYAIIKSEHMNVFARKDLEATEYNVVSK